MSAHDQAQTAPRHGQDAHGQGTDPHGHTAHGDGHGYGPHHVTPAATFLNVLLALLFLTVVTVGASRIDFGSANLFIAMLIAAIKASLVIAIFMHVKWDTAINRVVFLSSFLFLSLLFIFTLSDQATRGRANPVNKIKAPVDSQWVHPSKRVSPQ